MELSRRIRWRNWEGSRSVVRRSENRADKPGVTHARPHGQLSSWVRLLTTAETPIGSSSDPDFLQPQGCGIDVFVDISGVKQAGLSGLKEGQVVEYEEVANRGKTSVENLKV